MKQILLECNAGNIQAHRVPVLIDIQEFIEHGRKFCYSLKHYLAECWQLTDAEALLIFKQGRALVLLDGLDKAPGEVRNIIVRQIKRFVRVYPHVQVVVTSRSQNQNMAFEHFDYVEVANFNELQVQSFTENWFTIVMQDKAQGLAKSREFLAQLSQKENEQIRKLAVTPLFLSFVCALEILDTVDELVLRFQNEVNSIPEKDEEIQNILKYISRKTRSYEAKSGADQSYLSGLRSLYFGYIRMHTNIESVAKRVF